MRIRRSRIRRQAAVVGLLALSAPFACAPQFDATRDPAPRGTVGQELFGVICDRVSAQALPEDLTGASFKAVCHPTSAGVYADTVDVAQLPVPRATTTAAGEAVSIADAQATRAHALARIGALAQDRANLIEAFDATIPAIEIAVKDVTNANAAQSCSVNPAAPKDTLPRQLADMLERFGPLYDDGTIPQSTEATSRVFNAFQDSSEATTAYTHFDARQNYRPFALALGSIAPVLAYPDLRNFANITLDFLSSNTSPGAAVPTPGPGYPQLNALLAASYQELRTATGDGPVTLLATSAPDAVGRDVLSRPRTDLEFMQQLLYAENPAFGGGVSRYIALRDARGYAQVALEHGQAPPPFVDENGVAQINPLGEFLTTDGKPAPSPFSGAGGTEAPAYDSFDRALTGPSGRLYYDYLDTSHTYAASLLNDLKDLVVPNPAAEQETLTNALAGMYVLAGPRTKGSFSKKYPPDPTAAATWAVTNTGTPPAGLNEAEVTLDYQGFAAQSSPLLDLAYGALQAVPGPSNDDLLAYVNTLFAKETSQVARLVGDGLAMKANADAATTAHIPAKSTFWDEMIDVAVQIEQEPGLLEDVLTSLADSRTAGLGPAFSKYTQYNDAITYDRSNINGAAYNLTTGSVAPMQTPVNRSKPDTGTNRSAFQRFLQIVHDTDGVTICNKAGATVDAQVGVLGATVSVTMPSDDPCDNDSTIGGGDGTYPECGVYKIDNAAAFYLDSIIGKASLYLRDDELREGVGTDGTFCPDLGLEAATVSLMTDSSGITGTAGLWSSFWDGADSNSLRPTPQFLDRKEFFDLANDGADGSGPDALTNQFIYDLDGPNVGSSVCPERVITDPDPDAPDASPDGLVHGLRSCAEGDWLYQRDNNTIFVWEDFEFYSSMTPLITAFANHGREDLLIALMEVMDRHWADGQGTTDECLLSSDPSAPYKTCAKDGLVTYEPLLALQYASDILPALHDLANTLTTLKVPHCSSIDPTTHACTPTEVTGISVLAQATRQLLDPKIAAAQGLRDRTGHVTALRNDGTTNPQVTPVYLILEALNNMDAAFTTYAAANPTDTGRQNAWRTARSKLVDEFLSVSGSGATSAFKNASVPAIVPVIVSTLRDQVVANCPASFSPPYPSCPWATQTLIGNMQTTMEGPTFAALMGLGDAIRQDTGARTALESLVTYLLEPNGADGVSSALPSLLASTDDLIQVMRDDTNLVPFYHVAAEATRGSIVNGHGVLVQKGMTQASMDLLARLAGRSYAGSPQYENCAAEVDPNQVLTIALQHLVAPITKAGPLLGETPLQVIMDSIADVNRATPESVATLAPNDYASIASNVSEFMSSPTSGLEQFYAVVRLGTE